MPVFHDEKVIFAIICQYLPFETYLPCQEIPVNSTGKYRWCNFPPNLGVDSDEPAQPLFKLRKSKCCLVSSLTVIVYSSYKQRL